ncbi:transposase, partial [Streptomyces sp. NPDC001978]|uniref:transposase n=1 Tax=Streptomyces sp. NPDC001978 TaxID=3364627 RepID=UPI0036B66D16
TAIRLSLPCSAGVRFLPGLKAGASSEEPGDAERLAKLLRLDELPAVRVPTIEQESARDLTRARDDVRADLMSARHRLSKLLLRQGIVYSGGKAWTGAHHHWLTGHQFEYLGLRVAYDEALEAVPALEARRDRLDAAIAQLAAQPAWAPMAACLACLRGVSTLTAFGLAVEIGDWRRFTGATIGAYLGLVPTEDSSGDSRRQGSITKTGNTHARRLLVEAAWHHRRPYRRPGVALRARLEQVPARSASAPSGVTVGSTNAGRPWTRARNAPPSPWWPSPGRCPAGAGAWRPWTPEQSSPTDRLVEVSAGGAARGTIRDGPVGSLPDTQATPDS